LPLTFNQHVRYAAGVAHVNMTAKKQDDGSRKYSKNYTKCPDHIEQEAYSKKSIVIIGG
jgi:hypothetical protein